MRLNEAIACRSPDNDSDRNCRRHGLHLQSTGSGPRPSHCYFHLAPERSRIHFQQSRDHFATIVSLRHEANGA